MKISKKLKPQAMLALLAALVATDALAADRADWLRGAWGINWKPVNLYNGGHEGLSIEPFLEQIEGLRTVDYLQIHLGESSIKSSVHMGPHALLESFWQGDTDSSGNPINLVVPRAAFGSDPFLEIITATRAAGMRVMVYVNSSNLLSRDGLGGSNPSYIPNITERWKVWCDTNPEAQAFIESQPYHRMEGYPEREYMFCYAEFVLKVYAIRYGDLIDGWCFDSGRWMVANGDNATNGVYEDQMIYNAFAAACHAGNPNAALSFQNSPERDTEELNPFSEAVHADDFMFGHPYNGGKDGGSHTIGDPPLYDRNYAHIQKITETNGNVHAGIDPQDWTWDDEVVGHYDPPMSTTAWNGGNTPALTDDEFNLWNLEAMQGGGAISWGLPLVGKSGPNERLIAKDWALAQLTEMDAHLSELESPGAPNWARAFTVLPDAVVGEAYHHVLVEGVDFWDPEGDEIVSVVLGDGAPSWLGVSEDPENPGHWALTGTPTMSAAAELSFRLRVEDANGRNGDREVVLKVADDPQGVSAWMDRFPKLEGTDLEDDPDKDALSTLLEYVLDTNPTVSDLDQLFGYGVEEGSVVLSFDRRVESAEDTSQIFQYSSDLVGWEDIALTGVMGLEVSVGPVVEETEEMQIYLRTDLAEDSPLFVRLKVSGK